MPLAWRTWPHSVHSFNARSSLESEDALIWKTGLPLISWISLSAATALATTIGLASPIKSCSRVDKRGSRWGWLLRPLTHA